MGLRASPSTIFQSMALPCAVSRWHFWTTKLNLTPTVIWGLYIWEFFGSHSGLCCWQHEQCGRYQMPRAPVTIRPTPKVCWKSMTKATSYYHFFFPFSSWRMYLYNPLLVLEYISYTKSWSSPWHFHIHNALCYTRSHYPLCLYP